MSPYSRTTMRDVAKHAGVSHQTVSRVINFSDRVSPETRAKVEASIEALSYIPNAVARSMAIGRTCMLACLAPNLTDFTFASLIEGADTEARGSGFFLISSSAPTPEIFNNIQKELIDSRRVSGLIVINPYIDARQNALPFNFPVVLIGSRSRRQGISSVTLNDELAGYQAVQHLLSLGHRQVGMVTGHMAEDCAKNRCLGFEKAIKDGGVNHHASVVIEGDWSASSGYDALMKMAKKGQMPSAIFAQNDRMAIGVIQAARDLGIVVPQALSVIGVDDMPLASYFDPPLTTMGQDMIRIGAEAAKLLIDKIENPAYPSANINIDAKLVIRKSTAAINDYKRR